MPEMSVLVDVIRDSNGIYTLVFEGAASKMRQEIYLEAQDALEAWHRFSLALK